MTTACFTGHRKLNGQYYNASNPSIEWMTLKDYLVEMIHWFIINPDLNVDTFISGLAIGVDQIAAESVIEARQRPGIETNVQLIGAKPFPSQASRWPKPTYNHWEYVCSLCNHIYTISDDPYHPSKMQIRNQWMVNQSDYIIAVWDGTEHGGTWNCIDFARSQNKRILLINVLPGGCGAVWWT